jgi:cytochrome c-type biogenesis protein CcmH
MARLAIVGGIAALAVAIAIAAAPRAETADARVERLASELRCPVCQGLSVADSPSDTAREMRALVAQRVAEGRSDEEIRAEFRQAYGDWIFLSPPLLDARGLVWLLPLAAIVAGGLLVASRLGRAPPVAPVTPEQIALLSERARAEESAE